MVPFIDLKRFEPGFQDQWQKTVRDLSERAGFIGGEPVARLEERLAEYTQVSKAISCANGTDALQLALRAVGVGRGDKVLVPNMTFWATYEAVVNVGATPVTVDVDLMDGALDLSSLQKALESGDIKASILVHLYGWGSAHIHEIRAACAAAQIPLVEDGAQSFGTLIQGQSIYKDALIATTSFYPAKVLGAAGDAGAVFTQDAELADTVRCLANHGRSTHYGYAQVGWNSRMDTLQAAYLNLSLDHLDERIASRQAGAQYYREHLAHPEVKVIASPSGYTENGYCNVCLVENLDFKSRLEAVLKENSIGFGNIYPSTMSSQPPAAQYSDGHFGGDEAEKLCAQVLNLPLFAYMRSEELEEVVSLVSSVS